MDINSTPSCTGTLLRLVITSFSFCYEKKKLIPPVHNAPSISLRMYVPASCPLLSRRAGVDRQERTTPPAQTRTAMIARTAETWSSRLSPTRETPKQPSCCRSSLLRRARRCGDPACPGWPLGRRRLDRYRRLLHRRRLSYVLFSVGRHEKDIMQHVKERQ